MNELAMRKLNSKCVVRGEWPCYETVIKPKIQQLYPVSYNTYLIQTAFSSLNHAIN
jgi:hypothetical protein